MKNMEVREFFEFRALSCDCAFSRSTLLVTCIAFIEERSAFIAGSIRVQLLLHLTRGALLSSRVCAEYHQSYVFCKASKSVTVWMLI